MSNRFDSAPPNAPKDEFYIGWASAPPSTVRFIRPIAAALLVAVAVTAATLASLQRDPGPGTWHDDRVRAIEGIAFADPYAMIVVPGGSPDAEPQTMLLVEEGKFGALPRINALLGGRSGRSNGIAVRAMGTVLERDGMSMFELVAGLDGLRPLSDEEKSAPPNLHVPKHEVLAEATTLAGEIIDPKCFLGAMKPGGGKTHKACAMLCVAGGIPPMLVTRDSNGMETYLLVTSDGMPANDLVLPFVGDHVRITGRLELRGDLFVLAIAPNGIERQAVAFSEPVRGKAFAAGFDGTQRRRTALPSHRGP